MIVLNTIKYLKENYRISDSILKLTQKNENITGN